MMKTILSLLVLFISVNDGFVSRSFTIRDEFHFSRPHTSSRTSLDEGTVKNSASIPRKNRSVNISIPSLAGFLTGIASYVTQGIASDDYEIAELPPPYIPAIFGVLLLGGVGLLTATLGNVMDEEASLGMQSGARAKKEIERSKSSYFGKRR
mmetsp:Transcript_50965/g.51894  ORF Transcript_50965/g.51894 Transcript_50965/m.51894 type:complete len:152 (+) Transcript_50965:112-567(+)